MLTTSPNRINLNLISVSNNIHLQALHNYLKVVPGDKILILGGSGGVGSLAVQIAKNLGASVTTTSTNIDLLTKLGADRVINYSEENWAEVLKGAEFDGIFDCVGGAWTSGRSVLKASGGKYCTIVGDENDVAISVGGVMSMAGSMISRGVAGLLGFAPSYSQILTNAADTEGLSAIADLIEKGVVKPVMDPRPPFKLESESVLAMFELLMTHRVKGKLVLKVV